MSPRGGQSRAPHWPRPVLETLGTGLRDLDNPAQLDVLRRAHALLSDGRRPVRRP